MLVSTHSRAEAAALDCGLVKPLQFVSTHSRAEAAAVVNIIIVIYVSRFQHTAARRRLRDYCLTKKGAKEVSTHSRAEAAAKKDNKTNRINHVSTHSRAEAAAIKDFAMEINRLSFNTQPRGGGCDLVTLPNGHKGLVSTHSRAEAAALDNIFNDRFCQSFNTQPRGGGCFRHNH